LADHRETRRIFYQLMLSKITHGIEIKLILSKRVVIA